jgi:hypothetical protein
MTLDTLTVYGLMDIELLYKPHGEPPIRPVKRHGHKNTAGDGFDADTATRPGLVVSLSRLSTSSSVSILPCTNDTFNTSQPEENLAYSFLRLIMKNAILLEWLAHLIMFLSLVGAALIS